MQHIFMNNFQLCSEINERVVQHFVHCIETHGRSVQYIKFLQTIVKAEGKFIKKCQDMVMAEVGGRGGRPRSAPARGPGSLKLLHRVRLNGLALSPGPDRQK